MNTMTSPPIGPNDSSEHLVWLAKKAISGFVFAIFFVAMLLGFNVANLRNLMLNSNETWVVLPVFTFFLGLTFASIQMGIAIMTKRDNDDDDKRGKGPKLPNVDVILAQIFQAKPEPKPIRVKANRLY